MIELTKSQKKKVRALIEKGLMRDYLDGILRTKTIIDSFVEGKSDPKEYYHKLYSSLREKDKEIAQRYDDLRGSNYCLRLVMLVEAGVITRDEIQDLDADLKARLLLRSDF